MNDATVKLDRRRLRTERSQDAVIDAMLDLYREGRIRPSAAEIAARAGVSERTVFRLFDDLEAVATASIERQTARIGHLFAPPNNEGSRQERIDALVEQRIQLYEEIGPVVRAARLRVPFSPVLQAGFDRRRWLLRRQVERQFRQEVDELAEPARSELLASLEAATGIEMLEALRYVQGQSVPATSAIVVRTVRALLNDATPGGT
ncbi:MAG: TetR/AcrR family transcriptional regulator [Dehalococcoidia bacterium]